MRHAARRANRLLQVGLLMRSLPAYEHIKAVAASGEHGRLLSVATWRLGSYLHPDAPDHKAHYGDPSTELMTFDFDFIQWLMGPPSRLSASAARAGRRRARSPPFSIIRRPPGDRDRQWPDAAGFSLLRRLSRVVRTRFLRSPAVFEDGPPKSLHDLQWQKRRAPVPVPRATPIRSNCNASWIASTAAPIRRFWTLTGQSKP